METKPMQENRQEVIHRRAVQGMGVIVVLTVILAAYTQFTGGGARYAPEGQPIAMAELLFEDGARGLVTVDNAVTGARLIEYGENEGVFVRAVMRTVARQRRMRGLGRETPVRLAHYPDGQLWLIDPASGVDVYLNAFGPDNLAAFAEILEREEQSLRAEAEGGAS
jgi:putative photosynthetic complex assembly protein